jgi:hypothetical protein
MGIGQKNAAGLAMIAALLSVQTAQAKLTPDQIVRLEALPLDEICSKNDALTTAFGSTSHGLVANEYGTAEQKLGERFAPFDEARLRLSVQSGRFHFATITAKFDDFDDAIDAAKLIGKRYLDAGWHPADQMFFSYYGTFGFLAYEDPPPTPEVRLYSAPIVARNAPMPAGQRVVSMAMQAQGEKLNLFCFDPLEDIWAKTEIGLSRPIDLSIPALLPLTVRQEEDASACLDENKRSTFLASLNEPAKIQSSVNASIAIADWKRAVLVASGKTTSVELDAKLGPLIGAYHDGTKHLSPDWSAMMYFGVTNQSQEYCETAMRIGPAANALVKAAEPRLQTIHEALNAEANRLGVAITRPL